MKKKNKFIIFAILISISSLSGTHAQQYDTSMLEKTQSITLSGYLVDKQEEATTTNFDMNHSSSTANINEELISATYQSAMATFVKSLLNIASQKLKTEQKQLKNYLATHENAFSIPDWLNKFFTK